MYFSPHYDRTSFHPKRNLFHDISTGGYLRLYGKERELIKGKGNKFISTFPDVERLIIEDTFRQIDLFSKSKTNYFIDITLPKALKVTFETGSKRLKTDNQIYNTLYIDKKLQELNFIEHIQNRILFFFFKEHKYKYIDPIDLKHNISFKELVQQTPFHNFFTQLETLYNQNKIIFQNYSQQLGSKEDYPLEFSIQRDDLSIDFLYGIYSYYLKGETNANSATIFEALSILHSNITLEWVGISSGELGYFNLLARIYSCLNFDYVNSLNQSINNILILLDEPENSFHPKWQQSFLNNLILFLKKSFPNYNFQIIIASHSPILVSDFPKRNIIFLDKNRDGTCKVVDSIARDNTFGANIHSLYRNSFFLEGLPIGEFAKNKINKLFDELERGDIRETTLQEIQLIGEPLLKNQLMKFYKIHEKTNLNAKDLYIAQLEAENKDLKKKLYDKN